ncbi:hypothetical protein NUU61_005354 [Penicillium alfredii]|uniref:Uncharacterized protein n=1 Tax=Penicillium alfredii TaxID=1506179 RepID=A0A9W9K7I3_9EURO|nr:uncharacterized protein NUU61_005354 [Penicillium alfredii]KAJ5095998.1 hypothetical protein NUU61_005354 [Penicillium alfredii]
MPSLGRALITIAAISNVISPFLADFNHTHIYNPRWTGHAKYHTGQTLSFGVLLGISTLYYTWKEPRGKPESLWVAAWLGTMYWVTSLSAVLYPNTKAVDPEFGDGFPQLWVNTAHLTFVWGGLYLALAREGARQKRE